ncbi:hypothetical protein RIF29_00782 [Crotalaria pallida]|uniref:Uncharacterized protein n=1 Tax=Crotalaria pallida TaxID=3830 RepID=A0AAN9IW04_CROPI
MQTEVSLEGIDKDLDALSPKQLESVLQKLDDIRSAVKSKAAGKNVEGTGMIVDPKEVSDADVELNLQNKDSFGKNKDMNEKPTQPQNDEVIKRVSVWDTFDISKLRNAGDKLRFVEPVLKEGISIGKIDKSLDEGTIPEENREAATAMLKARSGDKGKGKVSDKLVDAECVGKENQSSNFGNEDMANVADLTIGNEDGTWTPVITRSKAQIRHMELQKGESSKCHPNG